MFQSVFRNGALIGSLFLSSAAIGANQNLSEAGEKTFFAFFDCVAAEARREIDGGASDVTMIAKKVRPVCHDEWASVLSGHSPADEADQREVDEIEDEYLKKIIQNERAKRRP